MCADIAAMGASLYCAPQYFRHTAKCNDVFTHIISTYAMNRMIEVARNSVQAWEIDQMGHMNVQFYVDRAADGLAALGVHLGIDDAQEWVVRSQHIRFLRERHLGSPYYVRAGILAVRDDELSVYQEMVDTVSGTIAAAFTLDVVLSDVATRTAQALPQAVCDKARALCIELPEHGRPKGMTLYPPRPELKLHEADTMGLVPTFQGVLQPAHCDRSGRLSLRHCMGLMSNAVPNLLAQALGADCNFNTEVGGATLEFRFVHRRYPRVDDVVTMRSGLRRVDTKTYAWCHWLFDLRTGEALISAETVAISLDLKARKAIAIPEDLRAHLETLLVADLSV